MYDEHEQLDGDLAHLAQLLRDSDLMMSCIQLAEFALKLDRIMRREERALAVAYERLSPPMPNPLAQVRSEHTSLRRLVGLIASALDGADERQGLELIGKLRSVLLLHLAKEETFQPLVHEHA